MFPTYLIAGLIGIAALCWVLYQANLRHRRLQAELLRLDRLAAEVTLHAEAVLDQVDERTAQLQKLLEAASAQVAVATGMASAQGTGYGRAHVPAHVATPVPQAAPAPPPQAPAAQPADENDSPRYSELRTKVAALAERGIAVAQIAQMLGVPRGEVSLILNLNKKKTSA